MTSHSQISYRLLTLEDAESYHSIRLECLKNYPENFGDSYEEELLISDSRFRQELTQQNNHSFWYGAFDAGKLIGISGFIQQKRMKTKHRGDLVQVYVNPGFANRGIGSRLIQLTIDKAFESASVEKILLSVVYSNDKAIALYKKFGFVQYGFIENYFKKNDTYSSQVFMALSRHVYSNLERVQKEQVFNEFLLKLRMSLN